MTKQALKKSLLEIADKVKDNTSVEDIYKQLSFLLDIEESEQQEKNGQTLTQKQVEKLSTLSESLREKTANAERNRY